MQIFSCLSFIYFLSIYFGLICVFCFVFGWFAVLCIVFSFSCLLHCVYLVFFLLLVYRVFFILLLFSIACCLLSMYCHRFRIISLEGVWEIIITVSPNVPASVSIKHVEWNIVVTLFDTRNSLTPRSSYAGISALIKRMPCYITCFEFEPNNRDVMTGPT